MPNEKTVVRALKAMGHPAEDIELALQLCAVIKLLDGWAFPVGNEIILHYAQSGDKVLEVAGYDTMTRRYAVNVLEITKVCREVGYPRVSIFPPFVRAVLRKEPVNEDPFETFAFGVACHELRHRLQNEKGDELRLIRNEDPRADHPMDSPDSLVGVAIKVASALAEGFELLDNVQQPEMEFDAIVVECLGLLEFLSAPDHSEEVLQALVMRVIYTE